ncbi:MAG: DUF4422 domain-containing protein [Firmicutes bacterium]|nr:DUF4422 domain-containing protein [Bacillota bacterium]
MKKEDLNIYVIMHKDVDLSKYKLDKCYKRLMVGKKETKIDNMLFDSVGDNISNKNKNYCELTGLYWMWKNTKSKYIGLCHYRRFFTSNKTLKILSEKNISTILDKYDVILPQRTKLDRSVYDRYNYGHFIGDLDECRNIISEKYPEYLDDFDKLKKMNMYYSCNMFIMSKEKMDEYCEWLFNILFEVEKRIDITGRVPYQQRVYGFLSERLFNVWLMHQNFKIHDNFVVNTEEKLLQRIKFIAFVILRKLRLY